MSTTQPYEPLALPRLDYNDRLKFNGAHPSVADPGLYTVVLTQTLTGVPTTPSFTKSMDFRVTAPRTSLPPQLFAMQYPTEGSSGKFAGVLPHVLFYRTTLPWERNPGESGSPWLALVVLTDDEAKAVSKKWSAVPAADKPTAKGGEVDDDDEQVSVLSLPVSKWRAVLPESAELKLLVHLRETHLPGEGSPVTSLSCVMGCRLPKPGARNTAYLVSIEDKYAGGSFCKNITTDSTAVELLVLSSWSFYCEAAGLDFKEMAGELHAGGLRLDTWPLKTSGTRNVVEKRLKSGFIPMAYKLRTGESTAAWYHGPIGPVREDKIDLPLPAKSADACLIVDRESGLIDASYAAAWTLGRSLALADTDFAMKVYRYKREHAHTARRAAQWLDCAYLPLDSTMTPYAKDSMETEILRLVKKKLEPLRKSAQEVAGNPQLFKRGLSSGTTVLATFYDIMARQKQRDVTLMPGERITAFDLIFKGLEDPKNRRDPNWLSLKLDNKDLHTWPDDLGVLFDGMMAAFLNFAGPQPPADVPKSKPADFSLLDADLPDGQILSWLNTEISLLRRVPFQYLAPWPALSPAKQELLPDKSVRFF